MLGNVPKLHAVQPQKSVQIFIYGSAVLQTVGQYPPPSKGNECQIFPKSSGPQLLSKVLLLLCREAAHLGQRLDISMADGLSTQCLLREALINKNSSKKEVQQRSQAEACHS